MCSKNAAPNLSLGRHGTGKTFLTLEVGQFIVHIQNAIYTYQFSMCFIRILISRKICQNGNEYIYTIYIYNNVILYVIIRIAPTGKKLYSIHHLA